MWSSLNSPFPVGRRRRVYNSHWTHMISYEHIWSHMCSYGQLCCDFIWYHMKSYHMKSHTGKVPLLANPLLAKSWPRTVVGQLFPEKRLNFIKDSDKTMTTFFSVRWQYLPNDIVVIIEHGNTGKVPLLANFWPTRGWPTTVLYL